MTERFKSTVPVITDARAYYGYLSGNHPTIHCNRFPSWEEISRHARVKWTKRFKRWRKDGPPNIKDHAERYWNQRELENF